MKVFLLISVLAAVGYQVASQSGCHMREVDLCLTSMIFQTQTEGLPVSEEDIKATCDAVDETYTCLSNYTTKCMTQIQRELVSLIADGSNELKDQFCKPSELRARYLSHAPCVSEIFEGDDNKRCVRDLQAAIEVLPALKFKQRLPGACCAYRRLKNCIHALMEAKCGKESVEVGSKILEIVVTDLPDRVCGSYDPKGDECSIIPPEGTKPQGSKSKSSLSKLLAAYTGD